MNPFTYARALDTSEALTLGTQPDAKYLGGGTNLLDLMRETVEHPSHLVDVTKLERGISETDSGGLRIGGACTNTGLAAHPLVRQRYPMLSRAILSGASGQIRNMATVGGNMLQRTRCTYFYDDAARCNKRDPGSGCDALEGFNRYHAILGTSDDCIATHPSDMCVALAALDAVVHLDHKDSKRSIPFTDLHTLPGDTPHIETTLKPGELITAIELPKLEAASIYRKIRDRASYAFALISVAAALEVTDGKISEIRLALGGVAHKPWRAHKAETLLRGQEPSEDNFAKAAAAELADARPFEHNAFKIDLAQRTIVATLSDLKGKKA